MQIGENIRELRIKKGLSQTELANQIGVGQSMIGHIERGAKIPSLIVALDLAKALGCTVEEMCADRNHI
ncbi:MAG: helix-turn-helix domain-containing protein [Acutalibacteraceae bacterium]